MRFGLLQGIQGDLMKVHRFAKKIDFGAVSKLITSQNVVLDCLHKDKRACSQEDFLQYLHNLIGNVDADLERRVPYGRDKLSARLNETLSHSGKFISILGTPNCGKSFLMHKLHESNKNSVVFADLRYFQGDIGAALLGNLTTSSNRIGRLFASTVIGAVTMLRALNINLPFSRAPVSVNFKEVSGPIEANTTKAVGTIIRELTKQFATNDKQKRISKGESPNVLTLIIDDADLAFDNEYSELTTKSARILLDTFVDITKKYHSANVILVSAKLSFPYDLARKLHFNTSYFTNVLLFPELAPWEIYHTLADNWKLGPSLTEMFN
jgi:hypothetical protein